MISSEGLPSFSGRKAQRKREQVIVHFNKKIEDYRKDIERYKKGREHELLSRRTDVEEEALSRAIRERTDEQWWQKEDFSYLTERLWDEAKTVVDAIYTLEILQLSQEKLDLTPQSTQVARKILQMYREGKPLREIFRVEVEHHEALDKQMPLFPASKAFLEKYRNDI